MAVEHAKVCGKHYESLEEVLPDIKTLLTEWKVLKVDFYIQDNGKLLVCRPLTKAEQVEINEQEKQHGVKKAEVVT